MFKGLIIKESLKDLNTKPYEQYIVHKYRHLMDSQFDIEIHELNVPDNDVLEVAYDVSKRLLPMRFYAHFLKNPEMLVAYPNVVVRIDCEDKESIKVAQKVGHLFGIKKRLMKYDEMFERDHPNDL